MKGYSILAAVRRVLGLGEKPEEPEEPDNANITYYPVVGGNIKFDKSTGTVTDCECSVTEADIPEEIEGVPVTAIGSGAFARSSGSLTSVVIPNSVTAINNAAFGNCHSLKSVSIPDSVTFIGNGAFIGCIGLTGISIPDSVTSLYNNVFYDCRRLTSIIIPNSVTSIGNGAFFCCPSLTDVYYDGTRAEYETNLLPKVDASNDRFLNATFHFKEDASPKPADSNHTAPRGSVFLLLAALTVYALGWAGGKMTSGLTK